MNKTPPCQIKIGRNGVRHILLVDIDANPNFFLACDERQSTRMEVIPMTEGIFVWCFCRKSKASLSKIVGKLTYFILLSDQRVEIDCTPLNTPDAAAVALTMTVGNLHEVIPLDIPFTILGNLSLVGEIQNRLGNSRNIAGVAIEDKGQGWIALLRNRLRMASFGV